MHQLTVSPELLRELALGMRNAVVVSADRAIMAGDQIVLREKRDTGEPRGFTGAWLLRRATHVSVEPGVLPDHRLVCLNSALENEWSATALSKEIESGARAGLSSDAVWARIEKSEHRARIVRHVGGERPACFRSERLGLIAEISTELEEVVQELHQPGFDGAA